MIDFYVLWGHFLCETHKYSRLRAVNYHNLANQQENGTESLLVNISFLSGPIFWKLTYTERGNYIFVFKLTFKNIFYCFFFNSAQRKVVIF